MIILGGKKLHPQDKKLDHMKTMATIADQSLSMCMVSGSCLLSQTFPLSTNNIGNAMDYFAFDWM